jgi:hypothetical protein
MTFMKKFLAVLGATALASGVSIATAQSASASGSSPITVSNPTIANGQAQTVTFGSGAGTIPLANPGMIQQILCEYKNGVYIPAKSPFMQYKAGDTVPPTLSVSAGTFNELMNKNNKAENDTYEWVWLDVYLKAGQSNPYCNDVALNLADMPSWSSDLVDHVEITQSVLWTVTPALDSPLAQTIYLNENNTTPATVTGSYLADALDIASRTSKWAQKDLNDCDPDAAPGQVDLTAMGLTLNTADSAIGEIAPLIISGTPIASSVGTNQICLKLSTSQSVYTIFNLTVAERPVVPTPAETVVPTLAETGVDSRLVMASGLIGSVAVGLGIAVLAFRRRNITK